jgi:hypothetical protein
LGAADAVQLRSASRVSGVRVHFVSRVAGAQGGLLGAAADLKLATPADLKLATPADLKLATPVLDAGPGQPVILARSVWAGRHAPAAKPPYYGSVKLAFIHHTDNPNGYGEGEVPALLLAIFDYHRYVRGYRDIAYNFIIDAFGRIWEARAGGIDEPVLGAHAGGFNAVSTGVAVLGTFMDSVPPQPAIDALEHLLAWKLSLHGIPTVGKVGVRVNPSDAFYTPFRPSQLVHLNRVSGHRDGDLTDCPGNAFYGRLPSLRSQIAGLAGTPARLHVAPSAAVVKPGATVSLTGRLALLNGQPLGGAPVAVQRLDSGVTTPLGSVVTDAAGGWSFALVVGRGLLVRALHEPAPASVSDVVEIDVAPVLTLTLNPGSPPTVTGTIAPPKAAVTLDTYRLSGQHRQLVKSRRVRVQRGRFSYRVPGVRRGRRLVVIARTTEGGGTLASQSPAVVVNP